MYSAFLVGTTFPRMKYIICSHSTSTSPPALVFWVDLLSPLGWGTNPWLWKPKPYIATTRCLFEPSQIKLIICRSSIMFYCYVPLALKLIENFPRICTKLEFQIFVVWIVIFYFFFTSYIFYCWDLFVTTYAFAIILHCIYLTTLLRNNSHTVKFPILKNIYSSVFVVIVAELYNYHHNLILEYFTFLKRNPVFICSHSPALDNY